MTGSLVLMVVITLVSAISFSQLKNANSWREHTYKVLAVAQTFLNDILRIQRDARNYVFTGQMRSSRLLNRACIVRLNN